MEIGRSFVIPKRAGRWNPHGGLRMPMATIECHQDPIYDVKLLGCHEDEHAAAFGETG